MSPGDANPMRLSDKKKVAFFGGELDTHSWACVCLLRKTFPFRLARKAIIKVSLSLCSRLLLRHVYTQILTNIWRYVSVCLTCIYYIPNQARSPDDDGDSVRAWPVVAQFLRHPRPSSRPSQRQTTQQRERKNHSPEIKMIKCSRDRRRKRRKKKLFLFYSPP